MNAPTIPLTAPAPGPQPVRSTQRSRAPQAAPEAGTTVKLSRVRRVIAARMVDSLRTAAQLTAVQEADFTPVYDVRDRVKERFREVEGFGLTPLAFVAHSVAAALADFPELNATVDEAIQMVSYHRPVHLGIAVDTPTGLMVPVVRDASGLTLPELAVRIGELALRVRSGEATTEDLTGSTFTITNIGSAGNLSDTPIINQPEVAVLGTGAVRRLPRVLVDDQGAEAVVVRAVGQLPLTYDHRLIDGAVAGRFLSAVRARLEQQDWSRHVQAYEAG